MKGACNIWLFSLLCVMVCVQCTDPLGQLIKARRTRRTVNYAYDEDSSSEYRPVYVQKNQDGLKKADEISSLPGQPPVPFSQYSGYVIVDPVSGRALFYYFTESEDSPTKPLVLWLNGGPGCSSIGSGAMTELGPFRVNPDGETLWLNEYAWNNEANMIFLESPAGVGFSYSNTTSDYTTGDKKTAADTYTFIVNWLERFPEYKNRDLYITGESYAGHYVPQLAKLILDNNKITNQTVINLKGIAIGNALIDDEDNNKGVNDYCWTHALISDEMHQRNDTRWKIGKINRYDIYAPLCSSSPLSSSSSMSSSSGFIPWTSTFDPCSDEYVFKYLNRFEVQSALHAFVNGTWEACSLKGGWDDWETTLLPTIKGLMASGIRIWIYSGDTDSVVPVTSTRNSITKLGAVVKTEWYPWYVQGQVGGYAVGYENLTFVTVRGAGHFVPSYQPERALVMFSSFLQGKLPPKQ